MVRSIDHVLEVKRDGVVEVAIVGDAGPGVGLFELIFTTKKAAGAPGASPSLSPSRSSSSNHGPRPSSMHHMLRSQPQYYGCRVSTYYPMAILTMADLAVWLEGLRALVLAAQRVAAEED